MGTDEWRAKAKALATEASDRFLVARDSAKLLSSVSALKTSLSPNLAALAAAFEQNISAVAATVGIPVTLASGASEGSHWQRIHSAERIRALKLEAKSGEDKAALDARRDSHALEAASRRMQEFASSPDGRDTIPSTI